ncbi:MAG: YggS family pyridoxal phosphate enzyme [Nitrospirae bacterium RIFCSPHIGHO2_02_FULL_40_19]|nr:MAG: YggS family pyridoxal phosphate enzyme [Nitrospirae bacterium RIFCSPHIGHO2_02_FULL_40_19]
MGTTEAVNAVQKRINNAAVKAGRNPADIKLVAVTKNVELPQIIEAVKAGVTILGENRVQEAQKKISNFKFQISNLRVEWHLIGSLQKNKAKYAVQLFDLIHTIDSIGLTEEVNKQAEKVGKIQRVLVQVKLSEEETKHGALEKDLIGLLEKIISMGNLKLEGLMTMPPYFENPEKTRPYFRQLRQLQDNINASRLSTGQAGITHYALRDLSMGMSNDFEVAIEEGATMVRIGTAIFADGS